MTVVCVNAAGVDTDEYFSLSYTLGTTEAAGPAATALGAYAWANNAHQEELRSRPRGGSSTACRSAR